LARSFWVWTAYTEKTQLFVVINRLQDFCLAVNRYQCLLCLSFSPVVRSQALAKATNKYWFSIVHAHSGTAG